MKAPRALPTCSGPVGLADTNSTLTERGRPGGDPAPARRVGEDRRRSSTSRAPSRSRRLRKPGGATSAAAIGVPAGSRSASATTSAASAAPIASGAIRYGRASFIARLLAKSPCDRVGRSLDLDGGAGRVVRPGGKRAGRDRPIPGAPDRRADVRTEGRGCLESGRIRVGHGAASSGGVPDGSGAAARLAGRARSPVTSPVLSYLADRRTGAGCTVVHRTRCGPDGFGAVQGHWRSRNSY